jgi:hypothetical protein
VIYTAMTGVLNVPNDDRFMVITEHDQADLVISPEHLGPVRREQRPDCAVGPAMDPVCAYGRQQPQSHDRAVPSPPAPQRPRMPLGNHNDDVRDGVGRQITPF